MKQYRPLLLIVITLLIGWTLLIQEVCAQQLKQIQKGTANNQIPVTNGYQNTQVYRNAIPYILDTLGIRDSLADDQTLTLLDSINRVFRLQISNGNTVKWKAGILVETDGGTTNELADFYENNPPPPSSWKKGDLWYAPSIGTLYISTGGVPSLVWKQADWNESNTGLQSYIKNKPDIGGMIHDSISTISGETQYLNPYVVATDTVGFYLTVAQDTVLFQNTIDTASYCCPPSIGNDTLYIGDNYVVLPSGEATTVGDTPTINMTLTGVNITGEVIDGSITPAKLDRTYLETEVDGSTTNEIELPSQTGNSGKYLTTNGTTPSWGTVSGGSSKVIDILGSDFTTSATSLQSTALAYTFPSTGTYEVKVYGSYTCSNTANGLSIGWIDSGGLVASYVTGKHSAFTNNGSSSSQEFRKPISAIGTTLITASVNASSTPYTLISETLITVSTAGTITYGFASGSGSYSATLQAGSSLIIEKLN